jgi:hypothetical protein
MPLARVTGISTARETKVRSASKTLPMPFTSSLIKSMLFIVFVLNSRFLNAANFGSEKIELGG